MFCDLETDFMDWGIYIIQIHDKLGSLNDIKHNQKSITMIPLAYDIETNIQVGILSVIWILYIWELYMSLRQVNFSRLNCSIRLLEGEANEILQYFGFVRTLGLYSGFVEESYTAILPFSQILYDLCTIYTVSKSSTWILSLQRKLMQRLVDPPSSLDGLMPADIYQKARSYSLDKSSYSIFTDLYGTIVNTVSQYWFFFCKNQAKHWKYGTFYQGATAFWIFLFFSNFHLN